MFAHFYVLFTPSHTLSCFSVYSCYLAQLEVFAWLLFLLFYSNEAFLKRKTYFPLFLILVKTINTEYLERCKSREGLRICYVGIHCGSP